MFLKVKISMMEKYKEIERSILTSSRKGLYRPFCKAINDYELIKDNDSIMVCMSGGKDSFIMAKLFEEYIKHSEVKFTVRYVLMDPGYLPNVVEKIKENAKLLNINLEIFKSDVFEVAILKDKEKPCYMCSRMRRGALYNYAKKIGCNKIALGHHFNDVIETTLLSMLYGGEVKTMLPLIHSDGIDLIRPMYLIHEEEIIKLKDRFNLKFVSCECPISNSEISNANNSKRKEIKELISKLKDTNENIEYNIFKAMTNVRLNSVLGYTLDDNDISFLDLYKKENKNG